MKKSFKLHPLFYILIGILFFMPFVNIECGIEKTVNAYETVEMSFDDAYSEEYADDGIVLIIFLLIPVVGLLGLFIKGLNKKIKYNSIISSIGFLYAVFLAIMISNKDFINIASGLILIMALYFIDAVLLFIVMRE